MTAEREAMTLERQAFEKWADDAGMGDKYRESMFAAWQAAISHLRAAEPVARVIEHDNWYHGSVTVRRLSDGGLSFHVLNDAEAQSLCAPLNDPLVPYTRPSEDARDAARYRWVRVHSTGPVEGWSTHSAPESFDEVIDAAMAKEFGR